MRERQKIHFIATRRKIDASIQDVMKNIGEALGLMRRNLIDAPNRFVSLCVQPKDGGLSGYFERQTAPSQIRIKTITELRRLLLQ